MIGNDEVTADNWNGGVQQNNGDPQPPSFEEQFRLYEPWDSMPITQQSAEDAYLLVLENAGAAFPKRDSLDTRIIDETRNGYATYEGTAYKEKYGIHMSDPDAISGIIDSQEEVGGFPLPESAPAPEDSDEDGMPDAWEMANFFNFT